MAGDIPDVPSPGGWLQTYGVRVARALTLGSASAALALSGYVAVTHYGTYNGGQQAFYCEGPLLQSTAKGGAGSCLTPLFESGAVTRLDVFVTTNPAGRTRLDVGTGSGASQSGQNLMNNVDISGAQRLLNWTWTGGALTGSAGNGFMPLAVLAPQNYTGNAKRYLTLSYGIGSGQVVGGYAGWYRAEIMPCSNAGAVRC